jgi:outer membrane protein TolC
MGFLLAFGVSGCAHGPNLATETQTVQRDPSEAVMAQMAPPEKVRVHLKHNKIAQSVFGRAVAQAVLQNSGVAGKSYKISGAEAAVKSAATAYSPKVSVGLDVGVASSYGVAGSRIGPVASLSQLVYDGAASKSRLLSRKNRLAVSLADIYVLASSTALHAVQANVDVVHYRTAERIAQDNLASHRTLMDKIQLRVDAGAGSEADLLAGKSRLSAALAKAIEATRNRRQAESAYQEIFDKAPVAGLNMPLAAPFIDEVYSKVGALRSPQLVRLDYRTNQALFDLATAEAARKPSITLGLTAAPIIGRTGLSADLGAKIGLTYDFLNGGDREAKIQEARANTGDLKAQRDQAQRRIIRALSFAKSDLTAANERQKSAKSALEAAKLSLDAAKNQFAIGRRTITQVLDAQREVTDASERLVAAQADAVLNGYAAYAITGDILLLFGIDGSALRKLGTPK